MQKVMMTLLIVMHIVFLLSYFIHSGIIFLTIYFWLIFCIVTFLMGVHFHFSDDPTLSKNLSYRLLAIFLTSLSVFNFLFILYVTFVNPFLYMNTKQSLFNILS
ncbi:hypothetical protein ROU88_06565 [Macrococcus capreoli]|uniref:hypothetical protein n=1 Tax=Macrococcus capreoli TaxID=2982690 RepID=UPI0021D5AD2E|nr:hypothetical protein [Macrococcus sp. TMW 2.2395]MCU7557017.1 hypothetical protein [Macrococcus sp. TMW 2.2395]